MRRLHRLNKSDPPAFCATLNFAAEHLLEQMPVAMLLILIAVAHQSHVHRPAQLLQQSQRELLAVIFDVAIARVDAGGFL
jgi:hypothetical protein